VFHAAIAHRAPQPPRARRPPIMARDIRSVAARSWRVAAQSRSL